MKTVDDGKTSVSAVEYAKKLRHKHILEKLKSGQAPTTPELRELQIYSGETVEDNRSRQIRYMQAKRRSERDIGAIPPIKNEKRRRRCEKDPRLFCRTYFPHIFFHPFTDDQQAWLDTCVEAIYNGGWRAEGMARGGGKTSIFKGVISWAINNGLLKYTLFIAASGDHAGRAVGDVKRMYEDSDTLAEDYPEICFPIRSLEGATQRANMQTCEGVRTGLVWGKKELVFPTVVVPWGNNAANAILVCAGIEASIRGLIRDGVRPGLVAIDDPETRESVYSPQETKKRRETIDRDLVGLGGQGKKLTMVMLCTISRKGCLAEEYTDRKQKPAWVGNRRKFLKALPTNTELWDKFIELRQTDQINGDDKGPTAHKFYVDNQEKMDEGAVISNPYAFDKKLQASALEFCYCRIADMGWDAFNCEYQCDPPDETAAETTSISIESVCRRQNSLPRGVVPQWCERLTVALDVHARDLYWSVVAWRCGMQGYIVDYGTELVHSPTGNVLADENQQAVDQAIISALNSWRDWEREGGFPMADSGEVRHVDLALIDSRWRTDPVVQFCRASAGGVYRPSMGFGSTQKQRYHAPQASNQRIKLGTNWHAVFDAQWHSWLWHVNSDYFKNSVHHAFAAPDGPGSLSLFKSEPVKHRSFAEQICSEVWTREFVGGPNRGYKEYFDVRSRANHWLDTLAYNCAAATMLGMRLTIKPLKRPVDTDAGKKIVENKSGLFGKSMGIRTKY